MPITWDNLSAIIVGAAATVTLFVQIMLAIRRGHGQAIWQTKVDSDIAQMNAAITEFKIGLQAAVNILSELGATVKEIGWRLSRVEESLGNIKATHKPS